MTTSTTSTDVIARCKPGIGCSTERPFFSAHELHDQLPSKVNEGEVGRILNELQLPDPLHDVYVHFANPNIEFYFGDATFMCLNSISSFRKDCLEHGQDRIIDLAFCYLGMGHIMVYAYDPVKKGIFVRRDGGSNPFDRAHNAESKYNMNVDYVEQFSVEAFLQRVEDTGCKTVE